MSCSAHGTREGQQCPRRRFQLYLETLIRGKQCLRVTLLCSVTHPRQQCLSPCTAPAAGLCSVRVKHPLHASQTELRSCAKGQASSACGVHRGGPVGMRFATFARGPRHFTQESSAMPLPPRESAVAPYRYADTPQRHLEEARSIQAVPRATRLPYQERRLQVS